MTVTLELSPDVEERLRTNAAVHGLPITEYLVTLAANDPLIDLSEFRDMSDFENSVAELREGFADLEAGRTFSLEEVIAQNRADRDTRRRQREAATTNSQTGIKL